MTVLVLLALEQSVRVKPTLMVLHLYLNIWTLNQESVSVIKSGL